MFCRWLATTVAMLQTLMAHVSEDILLSRIDQSGFRPRCANKPGTPLLPIEVGLLVPDVTTIYVIKVNA